MIQFSLINLKPQHFWGVFAGAILTACSALPVSGADSWKEEVLLHDGQKIIVERSQSYKGRSEPGQTAPIGEHTIRFILPGSGKQITWVSEYSEDLGRTNFNLKALHVKDGKPYVIAEPNLCLAYNKWGRPNPPYVVFQHDGNSWQRIAFETLPPEFKTVNTVQQIRDRDVERLVQAKQVSAGEVERLNRDLQRPESKSIVREKINYDSSCIPMLTNGKGLWLASGFFTRIPTLEKCLSACFVEKFDDLHCPCKNQFERK